MSTESEAAQDKCDVPCPACRREMNLIRTWRGRGAALGAVGGAIIACRTARVGAAIGTSLLPGLGTWIGMASGAMLGAATGAAVGDCVDQDLIGEYRCSACGYTCRLRPR